MSTIGNGVSNISSLSMKKFVVLVKRSAGASQSNLALDDGAAPVDGYDAEAIVLLANGYSHWTPLLTQRAQDGRCRLHFLFAFAQAVHAFDSVDIGDGK